MSFDPESVERFPICEEYDEPWGVRLSDYNKLLELYRTATQTAIGNFVKTGKVGQ